MAISEDQNPIGGGQGKTGNGPVTLFQGGVGGVKNSENSNDVGTAQPIATTTSAPPLPSVSSASTGLPGETPGVSANVGGLSTASSTGKTSAVSTGVGSSGTTALPRQDALKQAFVPAVSVPELQQNFSDKETPTFNDIGNVEQVGEGLQATDNNGQKKGSNLPKAGILSGLTQAAPALENLNKKKEETPVAPTKKSLNLPKWLYGVIGIFFIIVLGFLGWNLWGGKEEVETPIPTPPPQPKIVEYWGLFEPDEAWRSILNDFESETGISVNFVEMDLETYRLDLQNAIRNGNGPDAFRYHASWGPMLGEDLAVADVNTYSPTEFKTNFYQAASDYLVTEEGVRGLPIMYDGLTLVYNTTIFNEAGISPPSTWEQFRQVARDLTVRDEQGIIAQSGAAMGLADNVDHFSDVIGVLALQNGVDLSFEGGVEDATNLENLRIVLEYYINFYNNIEDQSWDVNLGSSLDAFAAGKVAMILVSSYRLNDLRNMNPDLGFATAVLPTTTGNNDPTWASFWAEGVNAQSSKQADAWTLIRYLSSAETQQKLYAEELTLGRRIGEIYSQVGMANSLSTNPDAQTILLDARRAKGFYMNGNTFDQGINDEIIEYYQQAITGLTTGAENVRTRLIMEQATELIVEGTHEVLRKYGLRSEE